MIVTGHFALAVSGTKNIVTSTTAPFIMTKLARTGNNHVVRHLSDARIRNKRGITVTDFPSKLQWI